MRYLLLAIPEMGRYISSGFGDLRSAHVVDPNPLTLAANDGPPGTRAIPTGTAVGPDGRQYALFSHPDGVKRPGINQFSTNGSVYDFTDPAHPFKVGDLPEIHQPSGAYDAASNRMFFVGTASDRESQLVNLPGNSGL